MPDGDPVKIALYGYTGMVGSEIEKLLSGRGDVRVAYRQNSKGVEGGLPGCAIAFLATKDAESMRYAREALGAGARVIDMSGAFRLGRAEFEKWYGLAHAAPELLGEAVYGLPAAYAAEIAGARLVAVPGCYPTAVILALRPLAGLLKGEAAVCATSGNSGARRETEAEPNEITYAYGSMHKHVPEMHKYTGFKISFTPVVLRSVFRGINANIRAELSDALAGTDCGEAALRLERAIAEAYAPDDLVEVVRDTKDYMYGTRDVAGTNKMLVKVNVDGGCAYINSLIDNLYKGAAGQAVECMNIMLGFPRLRGLNAGKETGAGAAK